MTTDGDDDAGDWGPVDDEPASEVTASEVTDRTFETDPERVELLRDVAADVRGETSESKQLANVLYRTSDLYDPDEETSPEEIVRNVKTILEVVERGGLER